MPEVDAWEVDLGVRLTWDEDWFPCLDFDDGRDLDGSRITLHCCDGVTRLVSIAHERNNYKE